MKRAFLIVAALLCLAPCATAGSLVGSGDPFTINFDENGKASGAVYQGASFMETGSLMADQSSFNLGKVLTYALPELVGPGGVNILDPNTMAISDNLFFYNNAANTFSYMEYMSQVGGGQLADTGVVDFGISQPQVPELANGTFSFVAGNGDPLYTNFYNGISSPTPEPATLTLLGICIAGMAGYGWRKRKPAVA